MAAIIPADEMRGFPRTQSFMSSEQNANEPSMTNVNVKSGITSKIALSSSRSILSNVSKLTSNSGHLKHMGEPVAYIGVTEHERSRIGNRGQEYPKRDAERDHAHPVGRHAVLVVDEQVGDQDYADESNWAALPGKVDPSDLVPVGVAPAPDDVPVDTLFCARGKTTATFPMRPTLAERRLCAQPQ